jgi:hypothetical protein
MGKCSRRDCIKKQIKIHEQYPTESNRELIIINILKLNSFEFTGINSNCSNGSGPDMNLTKIKQPQNDGETN